MLRSEWDTERGGPHNFVHLTLIFSGVYHIAWIETKRRHWVTLSPKTLWSEATDAKFEVKVGPCS